MAHEEGSVLATDPRQWSPIVWVAYATGLLFFAVFVRFFFRVQGLERVALGGEPAAVQRYNRYLRRWPHPLYAKMLGKRALRPTGPAYVPTAESDRSVDPPKP